MTDSEPEGDDDFSPSESLTDDESSESYAESDRDVSPLELGEGWGVHLRHRWLMRR